MQQFCNGEQFRFREKNVAKKTLCCVNMDKVLAPGQSQSDRALWHFWINGAIYLVKVAIIPTPLFPFFAHTLTYKSCINT